MKSSPPVMPLSEARQTNRSRIERILTRRDYINTVQLSYLACRTFIFHITSPYTNKSITDCIIIIYDIFFVVNSFLHFFYKSELLLRGRSLSLRSWVLTLRLASYRCAKKSLLKFCYSGRICLIKSSLCSPGFVEVTVKLQ